MGLNFGYVISVKKDKFKDALSILLGSSIKEGSLIDIYENRITEFYNQLSTKRLSEKIEMKYQFEATCSFGFLPDIEILKYIQGLSSNKYDSSNKSTWGAPFYINNKFIIGYFDVEFNFYKEEFPDTIIMTFYAVTSSMSVLLKESISIENYFVMLCETIEATYAFLDKEHEGKKIIWPAKFLSIES